MPTKKRDPRFVIAILLAVAICLTGLYFFSPANAGTLFTNAQSVRLLLLENTAVDGEPETLTYELNLEPGNQRIAELKERFTQFNCFRSAKQLEENGTLTVEDARLCFHLDISNGEKVSTITIAGKYLVSGGNVWKVGLSSTKADELQQQLKDFILEHSED